MVQQHRAEVLVKKEQKIIIIGAGPCGLGAAWRLTELGYGSFDLFEQKPYAGGLAASFVDPQGFTWDIGGHVLFSQYRYVDDLLKMLLDQRLITHERAAWCFLKGRFVPYPFQFNFRHLDQSDAERCLAGLRASVRSQGIQPEHFKDWILERMGEGIADLFMLPYNFKVWAHPLEQLSCSWLEERVAIPDLQLIQDNFACERDEQAWGPNAAFKYPDSGGSGAVWSALAQKIPPERLHFVRQIRAIDTKGRSLTLSNGTKIPYDCLISTMPLDLLLEMTGSQDMTRGCGLLHTATHVVGVGLKGTVPEHLRTKCWIYYPEGDTTFYRVTVLPSYAPGNVPAAGGPFWSLLAEVSDSLHKTVDPERLAEQVITGMLRVGLLRDRTEIASLWQHYEPYGYPVPGLERDEALGALESLEELGIYSRGRFGAWKYEAGNQDHALMQGIEVVDRLLSGTTETTVWHPEQVHR